MKPTKIWLKVIWRKMFKKFNYFCLVKIPYILYSCHIFSILNYFFCSYVYFKLVHFFVALSQPSIDNKFQQHFAKSKSFALNYLLWIRLFGLLALFSFSFPLRGQSYKKRWPNKSKYPFQILCWCIKPIWII